MSTPSVAQSHLHFILRRLHSLSGIVPIGIFLIFHLTTNSTLVWGAANGRADVYIDGDPGWWARGLVTFWEEVMFINGLPYLLLIEITLWLSIAFHTVLGFYYATSGKQNLARYSFQDNWRYSLQRWSGYIGIIFVFYHVATLRWGWDFLVPGGTKWSHHFTGATLSAALRGSWDGITALGVLVSTLYFVGVTMLVFHFANGLWTAAITWGVTISEKAQKRWGMACAGLGTVLMLMGWGSLFGALALNPREAAEVERALVVEHLGEEKANELYEELIVSRAGPAPETDGTAEPHGEGDAQAVSQAE